jgi:peptide chain release factor
MTRLVVTAGRGPMECRVAVAKVAAEIFREAAAVGLSATPTPGADPDGNGPLTVSVTLAGRGDVAAFIRSWLGTVQWIAPGALRREHRRRNWFVAVQPASAADEDLGFAAADVRFETMRAGGPGGQHQNRTESAVRAVHLPTGLSAVARDQRSQHRNRSVALARLAELLAARNAGAQARAARDNWAGRITVERGNPVRVYEGEAFRRRL